MHPIHNGLHFHDDKKGQIKNYIGVEMEISNFMPTLETKLATVLNKWRANVGGDGSIYSVGDNPNAFEIKTAPARGNAFVNQINEICAVLKEGKAKANSSCGLHLHIDARGFTPNDLIKVSAVWPKIQNKFWTKTFADRQTNGFCESWETIIEPTVNDSEFRRGSLLGMYEQVKSNAIDTGERYMNLNFQALKEFGTLENRMYHGTVNPKEIIAWANLNDKFINVVRKMKVREALKFDNPNKIIRTIKTQPKKARPALIALRNNRD